jgi:hypothetical protein
VWYFDQNTYEKKKHVIGFVRHEIVYRRYVPGTVQTTVLLSDFPSLEPTQPQPENPRGVIRIQDDNNSGQSISTTSEDGIQSASLW